MYRTKYAKDRILRRLRISKGHLEKIIKMVEQDEYYIKVLYQMNIVERELKMTGSIVMDRHLKICVTDTIKIGNQDEIVKDVLDAFKTGN